MSGKTVRLAVSLNQQELSELIRRYHLKNEDLKILLSLMNTLEKKMECKCCYLIEENNGYVIITLGEAVDELQDDYSGNDGLYEALLLDYLASELLGKAYEICNDILKREAGAFVKEYKFPGAELPISNLREICRICEQSIITYNEFCVIQPKKSTVFQVVFTDKPEERFCHICTNCGNKNCDQRKAKEDAVTKEQMSHANMNYSTGMY